MTRMPLRAVGIAWYKREHYRRILEIMEDADKLPRGYDTWFKKAQDLVSQVERNGQVAVRAMIDPDEFVAWCVARKLKVDAHARMQFGSEVAYRQVGQTH